MVFHTLPGKTTLFTREWGRDWRLRCTGRGGGGGGVGGWACVGGGGGWWDT